MACLTWEIVLGAFGWNRWVPQGQICLSRPLWILPHLSVHTSLMCLSPILYFNFEELVDIEEFLIDLPHESWDLQEWLGCWASCSAPTNRLYTLDWRFTNPSVLYIHAFSVVYTINDFSICLVWGETSLDLEEKHRSTNHKELNSVMYFQASSWEQWRELKWRVLLSVFRLNAGNQNRQSSFRRYIWRTDTATTLKGVMHRQWPTCPSHNHHCAQNPFNFIICLFLSSLRFRQLLSLLFTWVDCHLDPLPPSPEPRIFGHRVGSASSLTQNSVSRAIPSKRA